MRSFKNSKHYESLKFKNNGLVIDSGKVYDLKKDEDVKQFITREIENKEKTYDLDDDYAYNRR